MSESRIRQRTDSNENLGGTPGSYQVPEVYEPEKFGSGDLKQVIHLGDGGQLDAGLIETFAIRLNQRGLKGWHKGEEVFSLTNQGLKLTGDINAQSGVFSGEISIGEGDSIFKATEEGISLGADQWGNAPFRVTPEGKLFAVGATLETSAEGSKVVIDPDGITVLNISEDGDFVQSIRLGTSGDDFFSITNGVGMNVASISSVGAGSFASLSSTAWPQIAAGDWTGVGGMLDVILDRRPRGLLRNFSIPTAYPGTIAELGAFEFSALLYPGRTYLLTGRVLVSSTVAGDTAEVKVRCTATQPSLTSSLLTHGISEVNTIVRSVFIDRIFTLADLSLAVPTELRFLITYQRIAGTGSVSISGVGNNPTKFNVTDLGPLRTDGTVVANDGGGGVVVIPPSQRTLTVDGLWSNYYGGTGTLYSNVTDLRQGKTTINGDRKTMVGFRELTELVGATIESVTLRLHATSWKSTPAGVGAVGFHNKLIQPDVNTHLGDVTGVTADVFRASVWTGLGAGFIDLMPYAPQEWATGAKRGIHLGVVQGTTNGDNALVGTFGGPSDTVVNTRPQLTITYTV